MDTVPHVAVVGATGLVGRELLAVLAERAFPLEHLTALASPRSAGQAVPFGERELTVEDASAFDFASADLVLMSAGKAVSEQLGERAAQAGAYVIDNGSYFRQDADVPLVVPEVNPAALLGAAKRRIIANPNCSTIQLVMALGPLCEVAELTRVVACTYQAVSGAGQAGLGALAEETEALLNTRPLPAPHFAHRIAFNCVPLIDRLEPSGETFEEQKMRQESRKILALPELGVCATCVRVPVSAGHAVSFVAEFADEMDAERACGLWQDAAGITLFDRDGAPPTQADAAGQDQTLIGRVRDDESRPSSVAAWCVADNLRKGAAVNAVQIAELLRTAWATGALPPPRA